MGVLVIYMIKSAKHARAAGRRGNHSQKEVPSGNPSLKLEGVVLMHVVEAWSSGSAALGMARAPCSKLNGISLKLERGESPSASHFTVQRPVVRPMFSSPGGAPR